jgi:hypothetical protein
MTSPITNATVYDPSFSAEENLSLDQALESMISGIALSDMVRNQRMMSELLAENGLDS